MTTLEACLIAYGNFSMFGNGEQLIINSGDVMLTLLGIWNTAPLYTPVLASHFKSWMIVWSLTWGTVCPGKQGICYFSHFCLLSCFISAFVLRCESAYKKSIHPLQIMACAVMWPQKLLKKKKKKACTLVHSQRLACLFLFPLQKVQVTFTLHTLLKRFTWLFFCMSQKHGICKRGV